MRALAFRSSPQLALKQCKDMRMITLQKLWRAYEECRRRKKNTVNALRFEIDREKNLMKLFNDLQSRSYKISRHICFIVTFPTPREVFAADFRDRIVHHLLYNELYSMLDKVLIDDSYANRKRKGTHRAVYKLRTHMQQVVSKKRGGFYLKLDVKSFFRSIDRNILFTLVSNHINAMSIANPHLSTQWKEEIVWLIKIIIFHDPTSNFVYKGDPGKKDLIPYEKSLFYSKGRGLPIGNLTSQFFANLYLNELDQFITKKLGFRRYVRYVDDFIIIDEDQKQLKKIIPEINTFLIQHLTLSIHEKKICLQPLSHGVDFHGYYVKPDHMLVRQKVVKRLYAKIHVPRTGGDNLDISTINSYFGHFSHARSYTLRKHAAEKILSLSKKITFDKRYTQAHFADNSAMI
jgi:RNA-directed DNA polymerase